MGAGSFLRQCLACAPKMECVIILPQTVEHVQFYELIHQLYKSGANVGSMAYLYGHWIGTKIDLFRHTFAEAKCV